MIGQAYFPPWRMTKRFLAGILFFFRFSIFNLGKLSKLAHSKPAGQKYVRPPRRYEMPVYDPSMKYCRVKQKYLRPTVCCNSHAPEIIALAHQLGAYRNSDWDFAESAFNFVKRNITIEMIPLDGVEDTLRRGTGSCLHRVSLLVALCRAAGLKTRYKIYSLTYMDTLSETVDGDHMGRQWMDELGSLLLHGEAEIYIGGKWVTGNVGLTDERQASLNLPITKFGEISLGVLYDAYPESIVQLESIPYMIRTMSKIAYRLAARAVNTANANLLEQSKRGRAILDEKGEAAYDYQARQAAARRRPRAVMAEREEIRFIK